MSIILGVTHQFLYPEAMVDAEAHTRSLRAVAELTAVDALDCWLWRGERADEERRILSDSGKRINYCIGDRAGEQVFFPASPDKTVRQHAYDFLMREFTYALSLGAKKIVLASGPDLPEDRAGGKARFAELLCRVSDELPSDVTLAFEPTDRDLDKRFLFGPVDESAEFVRALRRDGLNIGMLLDMGHIPLMHATLETAVEMAGETLVHIHLGNCIVSDTAHPLYGDRHVVWSEPNSEYTEEDGIRFIKLLRNKGFFDRAEPTLSFEMRPYPGLSVEQSLDRFIETWKQGIK